MQVSMDKKLSIFLLIFLTLNITMVSAFEFSEIDNSLKYSNEDMKVELSNWFGWDWFGLGETDRIGTIELKSHASVNEKKYVSQGDSVVMWYDFNFNGEYENGLGDVEFIDMNTGKIIERNYEFVYLVNETYDVRIEDCDRYFKGLDTKCTLLRTEEETHEVWKLYNSRDIPAREIRIGIRTNVERDDYIDGIWTIGGKKIEKHATWAETDTVTQSHGVTLGSSSSTTLSVRGMNITIGDEDVVLVNYSIHASTVTNGTAILISGTGISGGTTGSPALVGGILASADVVGGVATFSTAPTTNVTLQAGQTYGVLVWATGTIRYGGATYPIANSYINWTKGMYNGASSQNNEANEILSIGVAPLIYNDPPNITLNSPENNINYTTSPIQVNFSCYASDDINLSSVGLYIDDSLDQLNSSGLNNTNYTFSKSLTEGLYNWTCEGTDNQSETTKPTERTFRIHTTTPNATIHYPKGRLGFHLIGDSLDFNWTVEEPGENLTTHIVNCTYEYNGVITEINNTVCTQTNHTTFIPVVGINNLTFRVTDEFGFVNTTTTSWSYQFLETNRTFNAAALQTGTETFQLTGIRNSAITSTTAIMNYNGTEYTSVKTGVGNNVIFTNVVGIPIDLEGNVSFYWTITYTNSTGTYSFNTTNSTQEIFALLLEECFAPTPDGLTLNFTTYETVNGSELNSTFEATFQFYAQSGSGSLIVEYLFSDLNENKSNYMFCLNSSGQNVTLDAFISYSATDYDRREYIINDGIIGNFTQDIPLYLTETELTDIVTIFVQDQGYDEIAGALVAIQEWNVGTNTYSTIGMLTTSSEGTGIIDLELYTTWYRAVVSINGEIVKVTDVEKRSSTSWTITIEIGEENPYDLFGSIAHGLTFDNETNITSFTWLDVSGYANRGCLVIQNSTSTGPETILNSCTSSVSGTIDYQLVGNGDYIAYGIIFLEGYNVSQIVDTLNIRLGTPEITEKVSPFGKVISFIAIGTAGLIGVAAESVILGGALIIVVLIVLMRMGFMNITSGFIWGIISIMIIVWFMQRSKK